MNLVILKFPIKHETVFAPDKSGFYLNMPKSSRVLKLDVQDGIPTIWAVVNLDDSPALPRRKFIMRETGQRWEDKGQDKYIDTIQIGRWVGHLFEVLHNPEVIP